MRHGHAFAPTITLALGVFLLLGSAAPAAATWYGAYWHAIDGSSTGIYVTNLGSEQDLTVTLYDDTGSVVGSLDWTLDEEHQEAFFTWEDDSLETEGGIDATGTGYFAITAEDERDLLITASVYSPPSRITVPLRYVRDGALPSLPNGGPGGGPGGPGGGPG